MYLARGVSNIFRERLIEDLNRKLRFKNVQIIAALKMMVESR
jgi:hypothetical protein